MKIALGGNTKYVGVIDEVGNVIDLGDIARGITDTDTRIDYVARVDSQPVFIGRAPSDTPTSTGVWAVEKITYDVSDRLVLKQVRTGAWDDRAILGW